MNQTKLRWLHVSDFHFKTGDPYDRDKVLNPLLEAIRQRRSDWPFDLIFATGDVAHSGDRSEYDRATPFFERLLEAAGLNRERLFVIPGNHDITKSKGLGLARTLETEGESASYFGLGRTPHHFAKLAEFRRWHDHLFKGARPKYVPQSTCQPIAELEVGGLRLGVLCINSALFSMPDGGDHGKLWIGRRCLDEATSDLHTRDLDLRIALVHHPLDWLHHEERANVVSKLQREFDFVLRGHLHEADVVNCATPWDRALYAAAGACYQTRKYPNRCLLTEVDLEIGRATLLPLRYEDNPHEQWTLDTALWPERDGYRGLFQIALKSVRWPRPPATTPETSPRAESALPPVSQNIQAPVMSASASPAPSVSDPVASDPDAGVTSDHVGQEFADQLDWFAGQWMARGPAVCFLEGFSGVGKSTLAGDLCERVRRKSIYVVVPEEVADPLDDVLLDMAMQLSQQGLPQMAEAVDTGTDLLLTLDEVMTEEVLIVIDEFQRAFAPGAGRAVGGLLRLITRFGQRRCRGRLLLLTHQRVERGKWSEPFAIRTLTAPNPDEAEDLLGRLLARDGRGDEVPGERRRDVVNWLGRNPRALGLLVAALQDDPLDALIGMAPDLWALRDRDVSPELVERLETQLLHRALGHMSEEGANLLETLAVYRVPFRREAFVPGAPGAPRPPIEELTSRFMLEHRLGWYTLNPVAREVALQRLRSRPSDLRRAHAAAGGHYTRHFKAQQIQGSGALGGHFVEARYHLVQAGRPDELQAIASRFDDHVKSTLGPTSPMPKTPQELAERIAILSGLLEEGGSKGLEYHLARLFQHRGAPGDTERALVHARRATGPAAPPESWLLRAQLETSLGNVGEAIAVLRQGVARVPPERNLFALYQLLGEVLAGDGQRAEAVKVLREGIARVPPERNLFALYQSLGELLAGEGQPAEAAEVLREGIARVPDSAVFALYQSLGELLAGDGQPAEAAEVLREGIARVPPERNLFALYQSLGELLAGEGQPAEAAEVLREGIARVPDGAIVFLCQSLGELLAGEGQRAEAIQVLLEGIARVPDSAVFSLYQALGELLAREGDLDSRTASDAR